LLNAYPQPSSRLLRGTGEGDEMETGRSRREEGEGMVYGGWEERLCVWRRW
jgi:hypothetical protein